MEKEILKIMVRYSISTSLSQSEMVRNSLYVYYLMHNYLKIVYKILKLYPHSEDKQQKLTDVDQEGTSHHLMLLNHSN